MLRFMFGEEPMRWEGESLETAEAIEAFIRHARRHAERQPDRSRRYITYAVWAEGLLRSMDELEQSRYAARRLAERIPRGAPDELTPEERMDYYRHVYFDKNAFFRVFSLLDKLGTLMNDKLELRTERIKTHFSYFTVLRNMRQNRLYPELTSVLNGIKERHQEAMGRLRKRRNVEVHQMNAELQDDLRQSLANGGDSTRLENLSANMADLDEGWEMARETLLRVFRYFGAGMPR